MAHRKYFVVSYLDGNQFNLKLLVSVHFGDMLTELLRSLSSFHRGEVPGTAHGVLPTPLHLCHHGHQRGTQVGHQHQEADSAQHHLAELRLRRTLQINWTAAADLGALLLSGRTGRCSRTNL